MDAKPNQLNLLEAVPNLIPNYIGLTSCGWGIENYLYMLRFDPTTEEYANFNMIVPKDLVAGSDVTAKLLWAPWAANTSGSPKSVIWRLETNHIIYPNALGAGEVHSDVEGVIPDQEAGVTMHLDTLGVISGLQAGENMTANLRRKAAESADTYTDDAYANSVLIMEYISTLLKKV